MHPRLCCSSFSSSATRLGGCDLVEHADPPLISWISDGIDFIGLIHFIVLIDWLLCVHLMLCFDFWMLRLGGKSGERFLVSHSSIFKQGVTFKTNCRSDKTGKQMSLLWAPSFSRHDVLSKERAPCLSFMRVPATVDCCSSA